MRLRVPAYPSAAAILLAFCAGTDPSFAIVISVSQAIAPPATASTATSSDGSKNLAPKVAAKIQAFVDRATEGKKRAWTVLMKAEVDGIAQTYQVPDSRRPELDAAAGHAIDESLTAWGKSLYGQFHDQMAAMDPDQAVKILDMRMPSAAMVSQNFVSFETTEPKIQPDWIAAVHKVLSPDQSTAWDKTRGDEEARVDKQLKAAVDRNKANARQQQESQVEAQCSEIKDSLHLSKDRADQLDALGRKVIDEATEKSAVGFRRTIQSMSKAQREMISNGNMFFGMNPTDQALQMPDWQEGLQALLGPDDLARLKAVQDQKHAGQQQLMGRVMVAILDDRIAFTADQRDKILPIATRVVKDESELYPPPGNGSEISFQTQSFYQAASKATDPELKAILDDSQFKRWRALQASPMGMPTADPIADAPPNPDDMGAPDPTERLISKFLYDLVGRKRAQMFDASQLEIEDIMRATKIDAEALRQLEVAAAGDTEQRLNGLRWNYEQNVRGQLQGPLAVGDLKTRLQNFANMFAQGNFDASQSASGILDAEAAEVLDEKQRTAWGKETGARTAFFNDAVVDLILTRLDDQIHLQPDQKTKLRPALASVVADCSPDIERMFSSPGNMPWFLSSQFQMIPLAGLLNTDLKADLTPEQLARCKGLQAMSNATSWWPNICNIHKGRTGKDLK